MPEDISQLQNLSQKDKEMMNVRPKEEEDAGIKKEIDTIAGSDFPEMKKSITDNNIRETFRYRLNNETNKQAGEQYALRAEEISRKLGDLITRTASYRNAEGVVLNTPQTRPFIKEGFILFKEWQNLIKEYDDRLHYLEQKEAEEAMLRGTTKDKL